MPNPRIQGTLLAQRQSREWKYDPTSGEIYAESWAGFGAAAMANLLAENRSNGIATEISESNGKYVLNQTDTSSSYTEDSWQIQQNELSIPVLKNPRHEPDNGAYKLLAKHIEVIGAYQRNEKTFDEATTLLATYPGTPELDNANALLLRIHRGEDHFARSGYVLRHTTNVGQDTTFNVADEHVDNIYSFAMLIAECTNATLWVSPLPTRLVTKINYLWTNRPTDLTGYLYGWLKRGSTESTAANNRIDITTEYWLNQWSTEEYADYIA